MNKDQILSMDTYMLLSFINMKLRDEFENVISLCKFYDLEEEDIINKLNTINYKYDTKTNQFK